MIQSNVNAETIGEYGSCPPPFLQDLTSFNFTPAFVPQIVESFISPFFCLLFHCFCEKNNAPTVNTTFGQVQGFAALNNSIDIFYGIPYAKTPSENLRFEKPVSPDPWSKPLNATMPKGACIPHASPDWLSTALQASNFTEDCLYLNVYKPHFANAFSNLPVLVLIHGGGFELGSMQSFQNYTDIGTNFVKHGIVVVSLQYRLGELGFATTGDNIMPGNIGLWDQLLALKFINQNVANFGGSPNKITLMGQSAGSASVSALGLSPHSRNLFQRAIQMSGSGLSPWIYGSRVKNETLLLAKTLNCGTTDSASIKSCLKSKNATELMKGVDKMGAARSEPNCIKFTPNFDGDFFPKTTLELIKDAPKKPTLIGYTEQEALIFTMLTGLNSTLTFQMIPWSEFGTYDAVNLLNYINGNVATEERFGSAADGNVTIDIFDFFDNLKMDMGSTKNSTFYLHQYTQVVSDLLFIMPILQEIQQKAAQSWPVYMYRNAYVNPAAVPPAVPIIKSYHLNDLNYVIWNPTVGYTFNEQDLKIQAFLQEAFRNFIKNGDPSTTENSPLKWPTVSNAAALQHVSIVAPTPIITSNPVDDVKRLNFWVQLSNKYSQFNLLQETRAK